MKKVLSVLLCLVLMFTVLPLGALNFSAKAYCGDVDDNGNITIVDVVLLAQFVAGLNVECNWEATDVNADNNVTLDDVVLLAMFVAGWDVEISKDSSGDDSIVTPPLEDDDEFIVSAQGGVAVSGGTITVPIVVEKNPGWCALDIRVNYDENVLELQCPNHEEGKRCTGKRLPSIDKKDDFIVPANYVCPNNGSAGEYHTENPYPLQWAYATIEEDITETGTYANLVFNVKDSAALGETTVELDVVTVYSYSGQYHPATVNNATINIIEKTNVEPPEAPEFVEVTATTVTLVAMEGYEYSLDGENWQNSNVFNNLDPNTEYTFYQRIAETTIHYASEPSAPLVVKTIKHTAENPVAPEGLEITATTITLVAMDGYEYSLDGENWQTSNVFENLAPNTEYTFYQRKAETDTHYASLPSALVVKTIKHNTADPVAPVEKSKTATSVILVAVEGCEYSIDGENWQTSNVFENLAPNTEYTFYQRIAETDTHYASVISAPLVVKTIKHTVSTPISPVIASKEATVIVLAAQQGYEYSIDGEAWQISNVFENLTPNTEYTFYQRVAETDTHYASVVSAPLVVKTIKHTASTPISPVIASKEATVIILAAQQGYEYSIDGETWQTSNVFENLTPGTTYTFYQRVAETATHYASETSVGTTCTTLKLQQTAPVAPVVLKAEATTVTLLAKEGYEYSLDGEIWQTSNVFENLAPNTEYTLYQRKAETNTHYASVPSAPLVVKTIKHTAENPVAPEGLEITATTVTLVAMDGYEYSLDGETWQTSNVFENLAPNTEYTFYQRSAETDTHYASAVSEKLVVKTIKHNTAAPVTPVEESKTATSVTLVAVEGYEYSMDGENWQTSNVFNNLAPNTEYTFYQRIAETNTHYVSAVSEKLVVKTIKHNAFAPNQPVVASKDATVVVLVSQSGCEYSLDGENWQTSNVFENLAPGTTYTFYQRVAETGTHYASKASGGTTCTTLKLQQTAPVAPVALMVEATTVTLSVKEGYEYSLDGETWQTTNAFENLAPNTEYAFYQRKAETDTHYASVPSAPLVVKTIKHTAETPVAPETLEITATTITLVAMDGYEYSLNGETWQTSNIFENLDPNTEYTFYQRIAETDTHYASVISAPLVVKTIKHTVSTPISPVIASKEATVIVLAAQQGYEYSIDGENWQTSNVFENLTPGTAYTFYQRVAETATHYASETSVGTTCTTLKLQQTAPVAPVVLKVEATTVTLLAKEGYEYSLDGENWQTSNVFENLAPNTEYTLYQRKTETNTYYSSSPSAPLIVKTKKQIAATPATPELLLATTTTVTLVKTQGYEYSIDGENWQTSNVFENLAANTEYVFYQRKAETDTHYVSATSAPLTVKTLKSYTPGDVNGDGYITIDDVVLLAQFVAGWDVTLN